MKKRWITALLALAFAVSLFPAVSVRAGAADNYGIWVSGTWVTEQNKDDVLGDGTVRYEPATRTLTLNNANIQGKQFDNNYTCGIYVGHEAKPENEILHISLMGENTVTAPAGQCHSTGIFANLSRTLAFSGSGSLIARAGQANNGGDSCGVYAGKVIVSGGTMRFLGGARSRWSVGINAEYGLEINNGEVVAMAEGTTPSSGYGIRAKSIIQRGGILKASGPVVLSSWLDLRNCSPAPLVRYSTHASQWADTVWDGNLSLTDETIRYVESIPIPADIPSATVNVGALTVRSTPSTDSKRVGGLSYGDTVRVLDVRDEWSLIPYPNDFGSYGWVMSKYLTPAESHVVTFDPQGGTVSPAQMETDQEGRLASLPTPTRAGYTFGGWVLDDGKDTPVTADTWFKQDTTVKAVWSRANPFVDVFESDYYYPAVMWAYYSDPQVTKGVDETHFSPAATVTRGQAVAFLWRAQGCPAPKTTSNPFTDVTSHDYYYQAVLWAVENGVTVGTSAATFSPGSTLSTQHIITFLYRTDHPGQDGWNGEAAEWARDAYGKPFGVDIKVSNSTPCPRRDVVTFLFRASFDG